MILAVPKKPRRFKVVLVNRIIFRLVLEKKHVASHTIWNGTRIVRFRSDMIKNALLRTADWGAVRTADYGLSIKHGLRYKTRTTHYRLGIKHELRYKTRTAALMKPTDCSPCYILTGGGN